MDPADLDMGGGKRLRDYQVRLIHELRRLFAQGKRRIIVNSPTGSGKTVCACALIKLAEENNRYSMFMAPRRELLKQTSASLDECGVRHSIIAAGFEYMPGANCSVVTKDTLAARTIRKNKIEIPKTHLFILDECHMSMATEYLRLVHRIESENPGMVTIGLSATPGRADGRGLGDFYDAMTVAAGYEELTNKGYLVGCRVFAPDCPDMRGVRSIDWDSEAAKRVDKPKLVGDVVDHWMKYAHDKKTIVFGASVSHAIHLRDEFVKHGISSACIDQSTPPDERDEIIGQLKRGDIQVLSNCAVLVAGFDEPSVSCVVLAAPGRSLANYRQKAGRAMRPCPEIGKTECVARDTLILTDKGLVQIQDVTLDHKVWDGVHFVRHGGSVCRGIRPVVTYDGLTATPEHKVMTHDGWKGIEEAASGRLRITRSGFGGNPIRIAYDCVSQGRGIVVQASGRCEVQSVPSAPHDVVQQPQEATKYCGVSALQRPTPSGSSYVVVLPVPANAAQVHEPKPRSLPLLRRKGDRVQVRVPESRISVGHGESRSPIGHVTGTRQEGQRWSLRTREPEVGDPCPATKQYPQELRSEAVIHPVSYKAPGDSVRRLNASSLDLYGNVRPTDHCEVELPVMQAKGEVWDILDAGPLQRFTANGLLVHNCTILDHSGEIFMHGFPDEDIEWPLEKSRSIDQEYQKKKQEGKARESIVCQNCHCVYSGRPDCPNCGSRFHRRGEDIAIQHGLLKEVKRESVAKGGPMDFERKQKYWHLCLGVMARKGLTAGAAAQMYSGRVGEPPWKTKGLTNVPDRNSWKKRVGDLYPQYARELASTK